MVYKDNAKQALVALLNNIQKAEGKEKYLKTIVIEDRVNYIIDNIINEVIAILRSQKKNGIG